MSKEALKLALEALEQWETGCGTTEYLAKVEKAIPFIREALAEQPAGPCDCHLSPVAKVVADFDGGQKRIVFLNEQRMTDTSVGTELGIHRQWQNLTIEEINEVLGSDIHDEPSGTLEFVRAIEAKLREKNT
jgi:hypothetical protein